MSLRMHMLGSPYLERDGERLTLEGRKTWALLAYLALDRAMTRREIVERLWSEANDPFAAMRWTLSQVRRAIAPDALIVDRDGALALDGAWRADARDLLDGVWDDAAIDLASSGDLLEGIDGLASADFDRWLSIARARVATARLDAIRSRAAALVRTDPLGALQLAERALAIEPFDDALHELVVECHLARGDAARASAYVEATGALYRRELGTAAPPRLARGLDRPRTRADGPLIRLDLEARALLDAALGRAQAAAWEDARDMTMRAIEAAAASGDRALEIRGIVAFLDVRTCQMGRGRAEWDPLLQRAYMLASEIGDQRLLWEVEIQRGRLAAIEGRLGTAQALLRRALSTARALNDGLSEATALRLLGTCETESCDHIEAEAHLRAAAEHPERRDAALAYLARALVRMGRLEDADKVADASARRLAAGEIVWAPLAIIQAAEVRLASGDLEGAGERFARALTIARETGDADWPTLALRGLAEIDRRTGRPGRALATLESALDNTRTHPGCRRWCEAVVLTDLVAWKEGTDRPQLARALDLTRSAPMPDLAARLAPFAASHTPAHTVVA